MKCSHCGTESEGNFCSNCGQELHRISSEGLSQKKKSPKKWIWAVITLFLFVAIISAISGENGQEETRDPSPGTEQVSETNENKSIENNESEIDENESLANNDFDEQQESHTDSEVEQYVAEVSSNAYSWSDVFYTIGDLFQNPQLNNENWIMDVATQISRMRSLADEAEQIDPPEKFRDMHETYMQGIREYKFVADKLPEAIDNQDVELLEECTKRMMSGNEYINQATEKIEQLNNQ